MKTKYILIWKTSLHVKDEVYMVKSIIIFYIQGSENLVNVERAHLIPKNRQGDYKVKRLDPETGDGRPARFLDAEEALEKDLLEEAKKQEKNRRNRKPKHDF